MLTKAKIEEKLERVKNVEKVDAQEGAEGHVVIQIRTVRYEMTRKGCGTWCTSRQQNERVATRIEEAIDANPGSSQNIVLKAAKCDPAKGKRVLGQMCKELRIARTVPKYYAKPGEPVVWRIVDAAERDGVLQKKGTDGYA